LNDKEIPPRHKVMVMMRGLTASLALEALSAEGEGQSVDERRHFLTRPLALAFAQGHVLETLVM